MRLSENLEIRANGLSPPCSHFVSTATAWRWRRV